MLVYSCSNRQLSFSENPHDTHVHNCPNLDMFVDVVGAV